MYMLKDLIESTPTVNLLVSTNILPLLLGSYTSPANPTLEQGIMHYFAYLLLLALSPFTILARPRLAQTALATSPVVTAFYEACDVYVDAVELAQLAVPVCRKREDLSDCVEKLVRTFPT